MDNPKTSWEAFFDDSASASSASHPPFSADSRALGPISSSNDGRTSEMGEWDFNSSGTRNNLPPIISPRRRSGNQTPQSTPNRTFLPTHNQRTLESKVAQLFTLVEALRDSFDELKETSDILKETLQNIERKLTTVMTSYAQLSLWTTNTDTCVANLTRQFAERVGVLVDEETEWDGTGATGVV